MIYTALLVLKARIRAVQLHAGQRYGDKGYMYHVDAVADRVAEVYGTDAFLERIVAYLHDTVEDTPYTLEELAEEFGMEAANAVDAMTKRDGEDYFDYIPRVKGNSIAKRVKKCDSFENLKQSFAEQRHKGIIKYTTVLQMLEAD
jgi:(p)ppGpp synthase/HD superfamily hydrolase